MKLNGNNIILDDDVMLTGEYAGKKLSEVLGGLQSRTSKLERYLKWIYKYGGVGGVGGGGGGNSTYSIVAKINGIDISGQNLALGKVGIYPVEIKINRPDGASFRVSYKYDTEVDGRTTSIEKSVTLDISNNYTFTTNLTLNTNGNLVVTAWDSVYNEEKQVNGRYITRSYNLSTKLVNDDGTLQQSEIFTSNANAYGLNVVLDYDVSVQAEVKYTFIFNTLTNTITKSGALNLSEKSITFNLKEIGSEEGWIISEENSGYYSGQVDVEINITNQGIIKESFPFNFTLVPQNLYLLVQPQVGNIYVNKPSDDSTNIYEYTPGYITFNLRPYNGVNTGTQCTIYYYLEKEGETKQEISTKVVNLRTLTSVQIYTTKIGWNKVHFRLVSSGLSYPSGEDTYVTYNFKVKENEADVKWPEVGRDGWFNYYRGDSRTTAFNSFHEIAKGEPYQQTTNKSPITIQGFSKSQSASDKFNTSLAIGFMYSDINSDDDVILTGYQVSGNSVTEQIRITQNKIILGNGSTTISYYMPKISSYKAEGFNYHLLNIVSRLINNNGTTSNYEVIVYIDGVIEGAASSYMSSSLNLDRLVIGSVNCQINLLDLNYLQTQYRTEGTKKISITEDITAYQYYLKYKSVFGGVTTPDEVTLMENCGSLTIDNNGDVSCIRDVVGNIAKNIEIPTLIMTLTDNDKSLKSYLEQSYEENDTRISKLETTLSWCPGKGKGDLNTINFPEGFNSAQFYMEIQGSSTKTFKCKNYTLSLENTVDDNQASRYLFSPNFKNDDKTTFLPEQSFTLKADVVDSSHSNNTSIGKFVNTITTQFNTNGTGGPLAGHVKNCLDGFPCLVFIELVSENKVTETTESICYYQGVYNFNLGRESFFNLGYKDCNVFYDSSGNSLLTDAGKDNSPFLLYALEASKDKFKTGVVVAEIQGNSPYFDFSQWDQSILFQSTNLSKETYMFGDIVTGDGIGDTQAKTVLQNFVQKVALAGGYIFGNDLLRKRFSESLDDHYGYDDGYNAVGEIVINNKGEKATLPLNQVPNYRHQFKKGVDTVTSEQIYIPNGVTVPGVSKTDITNLLGDLDNDIEPWLDYNSLAEYYTICMAFGLVDSVQKNMNIKTWNADPSTGKGKFYAAFYDMDTCLGINNAGRDTSYFAFSDYWDYREEEQADRVIPSGVTIYRDYSPKPDNADDSDYYDTASSYLFAVAKYARFIDLPNNDVTTMWPKELWAKWRGSYTSDLDPGYGCLRNAQYFIDNYFGNNLGSVPAPLISANYRNKYLYIKENASSFDTINFEKFKGTRIYKALDWLDGRFHILDAYFNLPETNSPITYYRKINEGGREYESYETINMGTGGLLNDIKVSGGNYNLSGNEDVTIMRDIFAGSSSNQSSVSLNILVRAKEYSPLIIDLPGTSLRYLIGGDKLYNLIATLNGMQTYSFKGSGSWTYLDSINSFGFPTLHVNAKYLEELHGTEGKMEINNVDAESGEGTRSIIMPSLKDLELRSSQYTGILTMLGSNYPNLRSIDISGSKINLTIRNSDLTSINASGVVADTLEISECKYLSSINLNNVTIDNCSINPVPVGLIRGSGLSAITATNHSWGSGGLRISPTVSDNSRGIKNLTVANTTNTGGVSRLEVTNDKRLTTLNVTGFSCIYVSNCPNLESIYITEPQVASGTIMGDNLTRLYVYNCGSTANNAIQIGNSETPRGTADLEQYANLQFIRLQTLPRLETVKLNKSQNTAKYLDTSAFQGNTDLKYISGGEITITGANTFYNSPNFTMFEDESKIKATDLKVAPNTTTLSGTFTNSSTGINGQINLAKAKAFIENIPTNNQITNITNIFYGQPISYTSTDLVWDLQHPTALRCINMSVLRKVNNVTGAFAYTGVTAWHRKMHSFGADVTTGITFDNYTLSSTTTVGTTYDAYTDIIDKINVIGWTNSGGDRIAVLNFYTNSGTQIASPAVKNFFHPDGKHPSRCNTVRYLDFKHNTSVDLSGLFANWTNLTTLQLFMQNQTTRPDGSLIGLNYLLNPSHPNAGNTIADKLPNLTSCYYCFNIPNHKLNLTTFADWQTISEKAINLFSGRRDTETQDSNTFNVKKWITKENFDLLMNTLVKSTSKITGLENIFRNTTVLINNKTDAVLSFGTGTGICNSITDMDMAFKNFKMVVVTPGFDPNDSNKLNEAIGSNGEYITITDGLFSRVPKVTSLAYCFYGMRIANRLPYDFFAKRKPKITSEFFIKSDTLTENQPSGYDQSIYEDKFIPIELDTFDYYRGSDSQALKDLTYCFGNVDWAKEARSFPPNNSIEFNKIRVMDGSNKVITTPGYTYYKLTSRIIENMTGSTTKYYYIPAGTFEPSTELTDTQGIEGTHTNEFNLTNSSGGSYNITNFSIDLNNVNNLFVAPDIVYGISSDCKLSHMFDDNTSGKTDGFLEGIIPEHLFKNHDRSIKYFMRNANIIPRKLGTYKNSSEQVTVYYYIPIGFAKTTDLSESFNFHINLPEPAGTIVTNEGSKLKSYNYYYLFLNSDQGKSLPTNIGFLKSSLPSTWKSWAGSDGTGWIDYSAYDYGLHYGYMFTPTYQNGVLTGGSDGIRTSVYTGLYIDDLINTTLSFFTSGHIFESTARLNSLKKTEEAYFLTANTWFNSNVPRVSYNLIFPTASGSLGGIHYINYSGASLHIKKKNIEGGEASYSAYRTIYPGTNTSSKIIVDD